MKSIASNAAAFFITLLSSCAKKSELPKSIVTTIRIENSDPNVMMKISSEITELLERQHIVYDGGSSAGVMYIEIKGNIKEMEISNSIEEIEAAGSVRVDVNGK